MIGYWLYKFEVEDRDIGVVDYVSIEETVDIKPPVASLCFIDPFIRSKLEKHFPGIDSSSYLDFLKGENFDENVNNVDYLNVSLNLDEFLLYGYSQMRNETIPTQDSLFNKESFNGFNKWGFFEKCFEVTSNKSSNHLYQIIIKYDLDRLRQYLGNDSMSFSVAINYPGQYLLRITLPDDVDMESENKNLLLNIEDIEVIKSRNTRIRKCTPYDDRKSFDDMVLYAHTISKGCNVPYLRGFKNFPKCHKKEDVKSLLYDYTIVQTKYYPVSCQRLSKIVYEVNRYDQYGQYRDYDSGTWELVIVYPQYYRVITQSKEVDVHALIGNIGGYIGLFLGMLVVIINTYMGAHKINIIQYIIPLLEYIRYSSFRIRTNTNSKPAV